MLAVRIKVKIPVLILPRRQDFYSGSLVCDCDFADKSIIETESDRAGDLQFLAARERRDAVLQFGVELVHEFVVIRVEFNHRGNTVALRREDEPRPCLPADVVLSQAPAVEQQRFKVPRILDEELPDE